MLKEFARLRQDATGFRRLFTDDHFDLYVWYPDRKMERIVGFQLVYHSGFEEKALTWTEKGGYLHTKIDDGDKKTNQSPILVQDGLFEYYSVHEDLRARLREVEEPIRALVLEKVEECEFRAERKS
jgi:hypothetical protein